MLLAWSAMNSCPAVLPQIPDGWAMTTLVAAAVPTDRAVVLLATHLPFPATVEMIKQQNCNESVTQRSDDDIRIADNESNRIAMSQWRSDDDIRMADNESNRIAMSQNCNSNNKWLSDINVRKEKNE